MRKTIFSVLCCAVVLLAAGLSVNAYEVVMKNGKVVKGDLVSQNDTMIVLKDASGIQLQLKKSTVDLAKTEAANVPPAPAPQKQQAPAPVSQKAKEQPKKPARVYTQKDLDRLRGEQDLGEGTFAAGAAETVPSATQTQAADKEAKKAEEREKKIADLQKRIEQTQNAYDSLSKQCDYLKTTNFQTNRLTDEKGNPLPYYDTIKSVCENADKAKANLDQLNQQLSTLQ